MPSIPKKAGPIKAQNNVEGVHQLSIRKHSFIFCQVYAEGKTGRYAACPRSGLISVRTGVTVKAVHRTSSMTWQFIGAGNPQFAGASFFVAFRFRFRLVKEFVLFQVESGVIRRLCLKDFVQLNTGQIFLLRGHGLG